MLHIGIPLIPTWAAVVLNGIHHVPHTCRLQRDVVQRPFIMHGYALYSDCALLKLNCNFVWL